MPAPSSTLTPADGLAKNERLTAAKVKGIKTRDFRELMRSENLTPADMKVIKKELAARKAEQDELDKELDAIGRPTE